ncbi:MAG: prepilin-type N-terminal cleavage/methylation domain-containing protein [Planctomycetes bacterium]|jgi:prepilin-type N-terminal cleavage/methylation domain-containing protein|nr:prepilin-type N-terminal cleavage/methylation domain-containing protein [Planctomycetota bacterium]
MRKAFTLMELVVSLGILAIVLSFAGAIFRVGIGSQQLALANAEIMQKYRAITSQLERDFEGMVLPYNGVLAARQLPARRQGQSVSVNSDAIALLVSGNFQTLREYGMGQKDSAGRSVLEPVVGNVACVFYEQPDPNSYGNTPADEWLPAETILLRRETILAGGLGPDPADANSGPHQEYYRTSLAQWKVSPPFATPEDWFLHPRIDRAAVADYQPTYLAQGVDNFTIEYAQRDPVTRRVATDSRGIRWQRDVAGAPGGTVLLSALRFTFTLHDSRGLIKGGRTFTHIVYLDN